MPAGRGRPTAPTGPALVNKYLPKSSNALERSAQTADRLKRRYCYARIAFQLSRLRPIRPQSLEVFQGLFAFCGAMIALRNKSHLMRYTDIAIVGGGLAGSTAAAML